MPCGVSRSCLASIGRKRMNILMQSLCCLTHPDPSASAVVDPFVVSLPIDEEEEALSPMRGGGDVALSMDEIRTTSSVGSFGDRSKDDDPSHPLASDSNRKATSLSALID